MEYTAPPPGVHTTLVPSADTATTPPLPGWLAAGVQEVPPSLECAALAEPPWPTRKMKAGFFSAKSRLVVVESVGLSYIFEGTTERSSWRNSNTWSCRRFD